MNNDRDIYAEMQEAAKRQVAKEIELDPNFQIADHFVYPVQLALWVNGKCNLVPVQPGGRAYLFLDDIHYDFRIRLERMMHHIKGSAWSSSALFLQTTVMVGSPAITFRRDRGEVRYTNSVLPHLEIELIW